MDTPPIISVSFPLTPLNQQHIYVIGNVICQSIEQLIRESHFLDIDPDKPSTGLYANSTENGSTACDRLRRVIDALRYSTSSIAELYIGFLNLSILLNSLEALALPDTPIRLLGSQYQETVNIITTAMCLRWEWLDQHTVT